MLGTFINAGLVLAGSIIGLLFKNRISDRFSAVIMQALALCVFGIGVSNVLKSSDTLCVIICLVVGTVIGEALRIEERLNGAGELLRRRLIREQGGGSRFTEGFVTSTLIYCIGAMAITGSIEAGLNHNYSILISKGVLDGVSSITFAAAMGVGVAFSVIPLTVYQGAITLLASVVGPYLGETVIAGMTAVGGTLIVGLSINMLNIPNVKIRVGNMLPAIFLPILYIPVVNWLAALIG